MRHRRDIGPRGPAPGNGVSRVLIAGLPEEIGDWLVAATPHLEVRTADDLASTRDRLASDAVDLLIIDQRLPGGSAEELLREWSARDDGARPRVLVCVESAAPPSTRRLVRELGVERILVHPLDRGEVVHQVSAMLPVASRGPDAAQTVDPRLGAGLAELWDRYRGTSYERVDRIEDAVFQLLEGRLDPETRREAERDAHKLVGSIGTFGFVEASAIAREAEEILGSGRELTPPDVLRLSDLVAALRAELQTGGAAITDHPEASAPRLPEVLLVDSDSAFTEEVSARLRARGHRPLVATHLDAVTEILARHAPIAAVVDPSLAAGTDVGRLALKAVSYHRNAIPTLVATSATGTGDRAAAASLGARAYLRKPITAARLVEEIEQAIERCRPKRARILAVDDDPQLLATLEQLLSGEGMEVVTLDDPLEFWDRFEEVRPDLTVLDVDMPHLNGIELCRAIRQDPRWAGHPILVLTAHGAPEIVHRVFAAGADDFVGKPLAGPELGARIRNRLERAEILRAATESDYLTGLPNRRKSTALAEQLRRLAARHGQPLGIALLHMDGIRGINARHGNPVGDRVLTRLAERLKGAFRGEDVVGRWGGAEFLLGMYGMSREHAESRIARVLEAFSSERFTGSDGEVFHASFSAGIAEAPRDGDDLDQLTRAAESALRGAQDRGPARISGTSAGSDEAQSVDVVLVEDDETLAALLRHALTTRGYRSHWIRGGHEAVEQLAGENPSVRGRLLLLDVDLPGVDGLALLRRLARDGVTRTARVVMLTARSGELEVVEALQLGAVDHVAKPFSVPVLMERVRRILES
jgi:diguanylate cyclase (GGDEF)-like protein